MNFENTSSIAKALITPGKGILAADESTSTIEKRFKANNIENTEENRKLYRNILFTTPNIEQFLSGVIMFEETIHQSSLDGRPFPSVLQERGILPGIKVDQGTRGFGNGEKITEGLEGLSEKLREYFQLGARFTKWRAVITIGQNIPTDECIVENAIRLTQFAKFTQDAGMVPIVEPEVLMDGDHSIDDCYQATKKTQEEVFNQLKQKGVRLDSMLLKPNMVLAGIDYAHQSSTEEVAQSTLKCLNETVPRDVPGIVFLSGGQSDEQAIRNLAAMHHLGKQPWALTYSFGRGLQQAALKALRGNINDPEKQKNAQQAFYEIAKKCSIAVQ